MIATEAGISPRTFFRYFETKESAAFPDHADRVKELAQRLEARLPSKQPLQDVADVSARSAIEYFDAPELYHRRYRLLRSSETLRDLERVFDRGYEQAIIGFLTNCDLDQVTASAYAAAVVAVVNASLDIWASSRVSDPGVARRALDAGIAFLVEAFSRGLEKADEGPLSPASIIAVAVPPGDPLLEELRTAVRRGASLAERSVGTSGSLD